MDIRNVAIIAHVDHGKTTLVDGLLKQSHTFRDNEAQMTQDLIMDSFDQERERGITILAKNTAIIYKGTKINIIDTPGHSDFGGEVERTLNMADGALLLVDAQEGTMPQTRFVLKKALELGLKIIVIVNKIDKNNARVKETLKSIYDLFLDLASCDEHLDFPIIYAVGRQGKAWEKEPENFDDLGDLSPIFEAILKYIPAPLADPAKPFQMQITNLDWSSFCGTYCIGRVSRGVAIPGMKVVNIAEGGSTILSTIDKVYLNQGLKRVETPKGVAGDIIAVTGIKFAEIGDTLCDPLSPEKLPRLKVEHPTISMSIGANTSPFKGTEGKFITARQILERIEKELKTNVAMKFKIDTEGRYILYGRGELHLSVFIETLRREGYEVEVGKPTVIFKEIEGVLSEPVEELTVDVESAYEGAIKAEIGKRRGVLLSQSQISENTLRMVFEITTRGIIGLRGVLLSISRGTAVASSVFLRYDKVSGQISKSRSGVLIASNTGKVVAYGLVTAQEKGATFVVPTDKVYAGQVIGINGRDSDMEINVCKEKQLTNNRSVGEDTVFLVPPTVFSLEQYLVFLEDDELLEVTPKSLRLRKKILESSLRHRQARKGKS
ncbi:translational GTPase TypA [Candidatus Parcubacteria bacterium]|nr:translational GTPase TypA [Patescibacteria group bacterium]MBU4380864.1 translational GTPase TypA [Patescibacteria group bacterium]MCG2688915.1 translational GTPase TypA [Candidatus Parcubacteria bacterium]